MFLSVFDIFKISIGPSSSHTMGPMIAAARFLRDLKKQTDQSDGMTCDPVNGLVQVPCIERNGMGAIKAVSAASLTLRGDGAHFMPLDNCIAAMRQTGLDMKETYKETSTGGLAVNLPEC